MSYKKEAANSSIQKHVLFAAGAGAIPLPLVDLAAVTAIQLDLVKQLSKIYDQNYSENIGKAFIASITSSTLARMGASIIKSIPGIGSLIGGVSMSIMSGASTYALGNVIATFFERNISLSDIDADMAREMYEEKVEEGKKVVEDLQKKQAEEKQEPQSESQSQDTPTAPPTEKKTDVYSELSKLGELRDKGIISDEEFAKMKKDIIDRF